MVVVQELLTAKIGSFRFHPEVHELSLHRRVQRVVLFKNIE
jgi:hypothetical protein